MATSLPGSSFDLLAAVEAALDADGLSVAVTDATGLAVPYVVVHPVGIDTDGPLGDHRTDTTHDVQTTVVAGAARGVEALKDRVRALLLPGLTPSGRTVHVELVASTGPLVDRDVEPPVFFGTDTYECWSTPT